MICPNCKTSNDSQYVFCVNCGASLGRPAAASDDVVPETVREVPGSLAYTPDNSVPTVFNAGSGFRPPAFTAADRYPGESDRKSPVGKIVAAAAVVVILLGAVGIGAFLIFAWPRGTSEALPDHLGMFAQNAERNHVDELKKIDLSNVVEGKDNLMKDDSLLLVDPSPNVILYSDGKDVPVSDLRLIQLDTIKDDGSFKQIDFQASPVDNKPEMKRLKIPGGLANGKYAFALIDGFLNEGKHKLWAFQVRGTAKQDNNGSLHPVTVAIKPSPSPTPKTTPTPAAVPPPPGGTVAYTTTSNLVLRSGPSQDAGKLRNLRKGEKVFILRYSENTEIFDGIESRFAFIQTEGGQTGWVFAAFLR